MKLYGYWRSQATFRVRVAMNLKGIPPAENEALDLAKGDQFNDAYRKINPQSVVPALIDGPGPALTQSMAIMEYLEETRPNPPLLPTAPRDRARVRALAMIPIAEIHPLMVPRVRNYVEKDLKLGEAVRVEWIRHWVGLGPHRHGGAFERRPAHGEVLPRRHDHDGGHLPRGPSDRRAELGLRRQALRDDHADLQ